MNCFTPAARIMEVASRVGDELRRRGIEPTSPEGMDAFRLAGMILARGGTIEDALLTVRNRLVEQLGMFEDDGETPPPLE